MAAEPIPEDIRDVPLSDSLAERYLSYALSTIVNRALPDARDGLKPVHRRLLHAMRQLGLDPASGFKKCARVVGDVIGKYHPHGDQSVYEALVRLAQDFAVRYPLVDGQGNFGNIDGDNAAAMRYTEARLTAHAEALLEGLDEDAVDFHATYDGEEREPDVLPAAIPNLLANGASGIAVGMATSIPPHNLEELADALLILIDRPSAKDSSILKCVPGPDLPTGGIIVEPRDQIEEAYRTGKGSFRLRARWEKEDLGRGTYQIVVTEIPWTVQKSKLIERIAELLEQRKLPLLNDVRDESAETIRLVLEPKSRTVEAEILMEQLFRATDLEIRLPLNMTVLDQGRVPKVMSLREALEAYLAHRGEVLVRRARHRLEKVQHRLEILDGNLIVYLNLDEVIRIIREADEPKPRLMARFKLSELQADAILNMRLRSLRRLEEMEIRTEHKALSKEAKDLKALLKSSELQSERLREEIEGIKRRFGKGTALGRRRTRFADPPIASVIPLEATIEREPITVICSDKGWIRAMKGRIENTAEIKYKEGDRGRFVLPAETTDRLILAATNGRFYTLNCDKLQGGRGHGEPLRLLIELPEDQDVVGLMVHRPGGKLLVASSDGRGFIASEDEILAQTRAGRQVLNLAEGAEARAAAPLEGDHVAVLGENRKLLLFPVSELPELPRGRGVILQRYKDGGLADVKSFDLKAGFHWVDAAGRTQSLGDPAPWLDARARAGRLVPRGFPKLTKFAPRP